mmetsp:Transcript_1335/g.3442  ORF Transcript_1335/g.3442 Transcript_1335/m.3442 type:complete len:966 (-) Transcript_1335:177-3074(-)
MAPKKSGPKVAKAAAAKVNTAAGQADGRAQGNRRRQSGHQITALQAPVSTATANIEHLKRVEEAWQLIIQHGAFADLVNDKPLGVGHLPDEFAFEGIGGQAVANEHGYDLAMLGTAKEYIAAGNFAWLKQGWMLNPAIPINHHGVKIMRDYLSKPRYFDENVLIEVAVPENMPWARLKQQFGSLQYVTPEEPMHALVLAVGDAIRDGASEETLRHWKAILLSQRMVFRQFTTQASMLYRNLTLREKTVTAFETMARSTFQRILEIVQFANFHPSLDPAKLASLWNEKVEMSRSGLSEAVTEHYVRVGLEVYNRCLHQESLRNMVAQLELVYGKTSPLNNLCVLDSIVRKCNGVVADMTWFLRHMEYSLKCQLLSVKDFSVRSLEGPGGGSVGLVSLVLAKKNMMEYFLHHKLIDLKAPAEALKIVQRLADHDTWMAEVGAGRVRADISWQGALPTSQRKMVSFLGITFTDSLDSSLKSSLKTTRQACDICGQKPFDAMLEEIEANIREESGETKKEVEATIAINRAPQPQEVLTLDDVLSPEQAALNLSNELDKWWDSVAMRVDQFVKLIPDSDSVVTLGNALQGSVLSRDIVRVGLYMDSARFGEASAQPHVRVPPYRTELGKKYIAAFIAGRAHRSEELEKDDMVFFKDGQRPGLESNISKQFLRSDGQKMAVSQFTFQLQYSAESYMARRERIKSFFSTTENLYVWTADGLKLEKKDRAHYVGNNYVLSIGPIGLPAHKDTWLQPAAAKDKIWGPTFKVLSGGPSPCPEVAKPTFGELEPVTWYAQKETYYESIVRDFQLNGIADACAVDPSFPVACIKMQVPYIGIAPTEFAVSSMRNHLLRSVWESFQDPDSSLYENGLAELLSVASSNVDPDMGPPCKKQKVRAAPTGAAKGGCKTAKSLAAATTKPKPEAKAPASEPKQAKSRATPQQHAKASKSTTAQVNELLEQLAQTEDALGADA